MVGNTSCHFCASMRGPMRVDEGVAEHRHEVVVLQDLALDLLRQLLALGAVDRCLVSVELGVEFLDADAVLAQLKPPHLNIDSYQLAQLPPMRAPLKMICTPGHSFRPPCSLQEDAALHGLQLGPDADRLELRQTRSPREK